MAVPLPPGGTPARPAGGVSLEEASAARQLAALTEGLQQRDQLIETLTERLEEAAEQLDRLQRTGADRGGRGGSSLGGVPTELVERHFELTGSLESLLIDWQEIEGASLLKRLDVRLDKLIEILRGEQPEVSPAVALEAPATEIDSPVTTSADRPPAAVEEAPVLRDAPAAVPDEEADSETLRRGIHERDDYITYLIRLLQQRQVREPIKWDSLQNAPEELTASLKQLEQRMQGDVQREELALSLERAKLARERVELERIQARLEREIRQLGMEAPSESSSASGEASPAGLSWRKLFGRGGN